MSKLLLLLLLTFVVIAVAILSLPLSNIHAQAQAQAQKEIAGFNNVTIKKAIENEEHASNIATLHNASYDKRLNIFTMKMLYVCLNILLDTNKWNGTAFYSLNADVLQSCDNTYTNALANRNNHNNQTTNLVAPISFLTGLTGFRQISSPISLYNANTTEINIARDYLKQRGIQ
jgi:hypothetical protein